MTTRRASVPATVVARDQAAARRGARRLVDLAADIGTAASAPETAAEQYDEVLRALAATVAAIRLGRPAPETWAIGVLAKHGLVPEPGVDPRAILSGRPGATRGPSAGDRPGDVRIRDVRLAVNAHAPQEARRFIAAAGFDWGLADWVLANAVAVVSELVTNAVRHARFTSEHSEIGLVAELSAERDLLTLEVHDPDVAKLPVWGQAPASRAVLDPETHAGESGAGLRIVAGLADRYGYAVTDDGKAVWAGISTRAEDDASRPGPASPA